MEFIQLNQSNPVWEITLARPEKRNALNFEMVAELKTVFDLAKSDNSCKAVILKALGDAFCAGADLQYLQKLQSFTFDENLADSQHLADLFLKMYEFPKLLISQVNGPALAGGCGLATIGDFCFATPESKFGYTEARIGFIPAIVMVFLLRRIGENKARDLMLTADIVDAAKALELGLVYRLVEAEKLDEEVLAFAQKLIERNAQQSITGIKEMIAQIPELTINEAVKYAAEMNATGRGKEDCKKGIDAFLNKSKPNWI